MENNLFSQAPNERGRENAVIGGRWTSRYTYVNGYYRAASVLANSALNNEPQDLLFYPICFNYRHCIELHLKALISDAENLHETYQDLGEEISALPIKPKRLMDSHKLDALFTYVESVLSLFSDEKIDPLVKEAILNLNSVDIDGQTFRYHTRKDETPTLPEQQLVDVRNLMDKMGLVHFSLSGIDMWLADKCEMARTILSELNRF